MVTRKRGVCTNCLRPDMALGHEDRCGSCSLAISGVPRENWPTVLAAAKEKYQGKPKMRMGKKAKVEGSVPKKRKSGAAISQLPGQAEAKVEEAASIKPETKRFFPSPVRKHRAFRIDFTLDSEKDIMLVKKIKQAAQDERRTVPAQVFYMLEKAMDIIYDNVM